MIFRKQFASSKIGICVALLSLPWSAHALTLNDYTSTFTAENIAKFLPGFTASQYADMANLVQVEIPGNSSCRTGLDSLLNGIDPGKSIGDSCSAFIDSRLISYGLFGTDWKPLEQILGLVGATQYVATVSPQITVSSVTSYIDTVTQVLHSIGGRTARGGPARFALGGVSGIAGGEANARMNGWVSANVNETRNTFGLSSHVGVLGNVMGGVDYRVDNNLTAGVSGGFDYSYVKTLFSRGLNEGKGFTLAPYVSYQFSELLNVDAIAGYSVGKTDVNNKIGGGTSGKQDYNRQFLAANLNATKWFGEWQATGKLGYTFASEKTEGTQALGTTDVRNTMQQMRIAAQIGYWMESWMPYAGIAYTQDLRLSYAHLIPNGMRDKNSYTLTLGADIFAKSGWNGGVVLTSEIDRKFVRNNALMGNLSYRF